MRDHLLLAVVGTIVAVLLGYGLALLGHPSSLWFFKMVGAM